LRGQLVLMGYTLAILQPANVIITQKIF